MIEFVAAARQPCPRRGRAGCDRQILGEL